MPIIITLVIAIFLILLSWTWHNLSNISNNKKIMVMIVSLTVLFVITFVLFNISKNGIEYENKESLDAVRNVLVLVFTIINGIIIMPPLAKVLGEINNKEIDIDEAKRKFIKTIIIFIIILIIECSYLKGIQQGIINIYNDALNK